MTLSLHCSLAALAAGACAGAQAARPLVTDDADVLERGACEVESYALRDRGAGATTRGGVVQAGCGIGLRTQLALAGIRETQAGRADLHGALLGKTGLVAREDDGAGLALGWGLGVLRTPGDAWRHDHSYLTLIATRRLGGAMTGHANLGWARSESGASSRTLWALAVERALGGGFDGMAEGYGDDRDRPWFGVGARWTASPSLSFNAAWAAQHAAPRSRQLSIGLRLGF
jgi:hypothetical protein